MKLNTRVFRLYKKKYRNMPELAKAMGMSKDLLYRVKKGNRGMSQKFILGAVKTFPEYGFAYLFYVSED